MTEQASFSFHDNSSIPPSVEPETDSSLDVVDSSSDSGQSSSAKEYHFEQTDARAEQAEGVDEMSQERGNYYPITWRVIGGGVMMSGPREYPVAVTRRGS